MSSRRRPLICSLLALAALAAAPGSASAETARDHVVVYHDHVERTAAVTDRREQALGFRSVHRYRAALHGFSAQLTDRQVAGLAADPAVQSVAPDRTFKTAGTLAAGETVPVGLRRVGAVNGTLTRGAASTPVAVLDSGVDFAHRDLNAVSGTNCIKPGTPAADDHGHGTHVAGTLAGANTGSGVVGVAPGTRIHSVKVLNAKGTGTLAQFLCGIDWVTANASALGIRVANMSIAGTGSDDGRCGAGSGDALHKAICASTTAGVTYVVAAGNAKVGFTKTAPAVYPQVLTVTAMTDYDGAPGALKTGCSKTEKDDTAGTYSNWAVSTTDRAHTVAAPGTCVVSATRGGATGTMTGTSMAAPHVAGALALCVGTSAGPGPCAGMTPAERISHVLARARDAATLQNGFAGDPLRPITGRWYGHLLFAGG
jgi:subtilisin